MTPPREWRWSMMTNNLPAVIREIAEVIAGPACDGDRYAVEIHVVGPLTVEEAVTALWERKRQVQIPVSEHVS